MRRLMVRRARLRLAVTMLTGVLAIGSGAAFATTSKKPPPTPPKKQIPTKPSCKAPVDRHHPCQRPRW